MQGSIPAFARLRLAFAVLLTVPATSTVPRVPCRPRAHGRRLGHHARHGRGLHQIRSPFGMPVRSPPEYLSRVLKLAKGFSPALSRLVKSICTTGAMQARANRRIPNAVSSKSSSAVRTLNLADHEERPQHGPVQGIQRIANGKSFGAAAGPKECSQQTQNKKRRHCGRWPTQIMSDRGRDIGIFRN